MRRVAFCIRSDWQIKHGGDVVQLLATKKAIESIGNYEVTIVSDPDKILDDDFDIVHIFNMQTFEESQRFLSAASETNAKKVLSTVYWNLSDSFYINSIKKFGIYPGNSSRLKAGRRVFEACASISASLLNKPKSFTKIYFEKMKEFLDGFDILLPNSEEEASIVNRIFKTVTPYRVVYNAVDSDIFVYAENPNRRGVISVGRIEPVKNQLQVVRALEKDIEIPVTFVGGVTNDNLEYCEYLRSISNQRGNVEIVATNQSQNNLIELYQNAKVHVLPSFRESPGLSSLEAFSCGANIVVSEEAYCPVNTYFSKYLGSHVFLCDPYSKSSIRNAVMKALNAKEKEKRVFGWDLAANQTILAYNSLF